MSLGLALLRPTHSDAGKLKPNALPRSTGKKHSPWSNYFPNYVLRTHEGDSVRFYDDLIKDRMVMINLIYTSCPAACPLTTSNLVRLQRALGDRVGREIFMYSISLDPLRDNPGVLKRYAKNFGVKPGWRFLTGEPDEIDLLRRKLGFIHPDPETDKRKDSHTGALRIGNDALDRWTMKNALSKPAGILETIRIVMPIKSPA